MANKYLDSPSWILQTKAKARGTLPTCDDSTFNTNIAKWFAFQNLLQKSVTPATPYSNPIVSTYSLVYTTSSAYTGGVLDPNNTLHLIPESASVGQKILANGVVSTYSLVYTRPNAYYSGVLNQNGDIHFIPFYAAVGQKISATGVVSTYSLVYTLSSAYIGGILDPTGDIHMIPNNGTSLTSSLISNKLNWSVIAPFAS